VWIAIGNKDHPPRLDYPLLRTVRFSDAALAAGVETRRVDGVAVRVTNVAKTVADCFKFRNKIGLDVALEALREARRAKKASADDLWHFAKINRVTNVMRPYLEAVA
jgi:predicted transcriptional regulator of viral defense system